MLWGVAEQGLLEFGDSGPVPSSQRLRRTSEKGRESSGLKARYFGADLNVNIYLYRSRKIF